MSYPHDSATSAMPAAALAPAALWFSLQGWRRRLLFVTLFELSAIACTSWGLARMSGDAVAHAGVMGVASSAIAVLWNLLFNTLFERWEARQTVRGRSIARRMAHATCFEGGLVVTLVPLFAWWFQVGLWQALLMDLGLMAFFLAYTFGFNWAFDRVFGLPSSAS